MPYPLLDRLTDDLGWPLLGSQPALDGWLAEPGTRCLFVTGDPAKNLETLDVAVILPEIVSAFGEAFQVALVGPEIERAVRDRYKVWPMPSLIFLREGAFLGAIPKVRDWDDYLERTRLVLSGGALETV